MTNSFNNPYAKDSPYLQVKRKELADVVRKGANALEALAVHLTERPLYRISSVACYDYHIMAIHSIIESLMLLGFSHSQIAGLIGDEIFNLAVKHNKID